MMLMRSRLACGLTVLAWILSSGGASAQVIDLFDNQESMPVGSIEGVFVGDDAAARGSDSGRLDGGIRLPFLRDRGAIFVEAKVHGQPHLFLLDTGASGTTLTSAVAAAVRITPGPDSPKVMMQTASGVMETRQGIMDRFELGNRTLRRVTFTICDPCGALQFRGRPVAGLLGMNVLSRYRMNLDDSRGMLELIPNSAFVNQWADIEPWLRIQYVGQRYTSSARQEMLVRVMLVNASSHPITDVKVELTCRGSSGTVQSSIGSVARVNPGRPAEVDLRAKITECEQVETRIVEARW
jgi:hypothetical protein